MTDSDKEFAVKYYYDNFIKYKVFLMKIILMQ